MRIMLGAVSAGLMILTATPAAAEPAPAPDPVLIVPEQQVAPSPLGAFTGDPLAAAALLMPQNFGMPTAGQISPYALGSNPPSPFARIDAFQGAHALVHGGIGQMPADQLGQPLPGTAPPPGTAVPPGLVQYLPEPAPAAPAVPLLPPPAPQN
jgi:hypothetical protein